MADTVKRMNYYDHQFLRAPDFTDEQKYHLNMRRLHNRALHTWGIVQGLDVAAAGGGTGTAVTVNAGVAIDSSGREVVLPADTNLELGGEAAGSTLFITIAYDEQQSDPTVEAGGPGNTRISELPKLSFSTVAPADKSTNMILAKVPRTTTGLGAVDASDRRQAGVVLGSDLVAKTLTLSKDGVAQPNWPVLSCPGGNQLGIAGASLSLDAQREIVFADQGQIRSLDQNHKMVFNRAQNLLELWEFGDIRFLAGGSPPAERMRIQASGNVGIGTASAAAKLHVYSTANPATVRIHSSASSGVGKLEFWSDPQGSATEWRPASIKSVDAGGFTGGIAFLTNGSGQPNATAEVETMRITNGRVGLGLPNPDRNLTVFASGAGSGVYANVKNSNHEILIGVDATAIVSAMTASDLQLRTNNTPRMVVQANTGFVGIGVPAPSRQLDVRAAGGIKLGLEGNGGGQLILTNNANDNRVWLEAFNSAGNGHAAEFLLTGMNGQNVPRLTFNSDFTQANGSFALGNSDIYFTKTNHGHSGFGNALGFAAIENDGTQYNALMIIGRTISTNPLMRVVKMWDRFEMNGDAFKPGGGAWGTLSDRRLKKNVSPLTGALDKLLSLEGVTFEWNEPDKFANLTGTQMGLVAQDVEKVFPEWVGEDIDGVKTLSIRGFEALVIEALRELSASVSAIQESLATLQKAGDKPPKSSGRKSVG